MTDGKARCAWGEGSPAYVAYHDTEWGVPERGARRLFEFVLLEGAQAGLSWSTILNKREGYARCFADFDPVAVAAFGDDDVARCLADPGIVRNRAKVTAAVGNAKAWLELDDPVAFMWDFVDGVPVQNAWRELSDIPATTPVSDAMSKALKRRGFRFVGPTICYAHMQASGMVNDHLVSCFRHDECAQLA
ncbi:MAG TPA: DNA-3-methyladenine glycosylase I [Ilumatobacteraceae bacterium]|nr:DNA-3-methyladenine glycosylase I [Ilumatobacteraceae bacterium]